MHNKSLQKLIQNLNEFGFEKMAEEIEDLLEIDNQDREVSADRRRALKGKSYLELTGKKYVVIYRAVDSDEWYFNPMDYVTLSRKFAYEHAGHEVVIDEKDQHVITAMVKGSEIFQAPNTDEWFYDGPSIKGKRSKLFKSAGANEPEQYTLFDPFQLDMFGKHTQNRPESGQEQSDDKYALIESMNFSSPDDEEKSKSSKAIFEGYRKQIARILLDTEPDHDANQIYKAVMSIGVHDLRGELLKLLNNHPEYKAKIPVPQLSLPFEGSGPEQARFLPSPSGLSLEKIKYIQNYKNRVEKQREIISAWEDETGLEFDISSIQVRSNVRDWWKAKTGEEFSIIGEWWYADNESKALNVEVDTDVPAELYKALEKSLLEAYYDVEKRQSELRKLSGEMRKFSYDKPEKIETFTSVDDLILNLAGHLRWSVGQVLNASIGIGLFGAKTGRESGRGAIPVVRNFFSKKEKDWYNDPSSIVKYMESGPTIPSSLYEMQKMAKETTESWFITKYNELESYTDSLERSIKSIKKGISFLEKYDKDADAKIAHLIKSMDVRLKEWVGKNHSDKLMKRYDSFISALSKDFSSAAEFAQMPTDRGLVPIGEHVKDYNFEKIEELQLNTFDVGMIVMHSKTYVEAIDDLISFVIGLWNNSIAEINKLTIAPGVEALVEEFWDKHVKLFTGFESNYDVSSIKLESPESISVANNWLLYTKGTSKNWESVVQYPKFISQIQDKKERQLLSDIMLTRIGVAVAHAVRYNYRIKESITSKLFAFFEKNAPNGSTISEWTNDAIEKYSDEIDNLIKDIVVDKADLSLSGDRDSGKFRITDIDVDKHPPVRYKDLASVLSIRPVDKLLKRLDASKIEDTQYDQTRIGYHIVGTMLYGRFGETEYLNILSTDASSIKGNVYRTCEYIEELVHTATGEWVSVDDSGSIFEWLERLNNSIQAISKLPVIEMFDPVKESMTEYTRRSGNFKRMHRDIPLLKKTLPNAIRQLKLVCREGLYAELFSNRMKTIGGVGPKAINEKIKSISDGNELAKGLPLLQAFTGIDGINDSSLANVENMVENLMQPKDIASRSLVKDPVLDLITGMSEPLDKMDTSVFLSLWLSKYFNISNGQQIKAICDVVKNNLPYQSQTGNFGQEEIRKWFPKIIGTNLKTLPAKIAKAAHFAGYVHNYANDVPDNFLESAMKNPNFDSWDLAQNGNETIKQFFSVAVRLKRMGGYKGIVDNSALVLKRLMDQKIIRRGFKKRTIDFASLFKNGTRLHPDAIGKDEYEKAKSLILELNMDLKSIQNHEIYSKFNTEVKEKKEELFRLEWAPDNAKFRFRVLKTFDPYHFQVGSDTNCCQVIGGVGENAAKDSYVNPYSGVLVLEFKTPDGWKMAAQSYFHWTPQDNGYILDNVEKNSLLSQVKAYTGYDAETLYAMLAQKTKEKYKSEYFLMGGGHTKLSEKRFKKDRTLSKDPRQFVYKYTDWATNDSYDLSNPNFEVPEFKIKKESLWNFDIIVMAHEWAKKGRKKESELLMEALDISMI